MLGRFATGTVTEPASPTDRVNDARATQALLRRGFLQKPKGGAVLVTPEGLAALLDTVPIQHLTPSSPPHALVPVGCVHSPEYSSAYVGGIVRAARPSTLLNAVIG